LTLKSVVETSTKFAAIPDNQGRDNATSHALVSIINKAKADAAILLNANSGQFFVGESGTELLFRLIRSAVMASPKSGSVLGSTLEHPASRSAARHWADHAGLDYISVPHNDATGSVDAEDYAKAVQPNTQVATILHTSPVTGMSVDVAAIAKAIRAVAPDCFIIVDGIQHAAHGHIDLAAYDVDGYAISPYKMFSRHGFGLAWVSDRLAALPHEKLIDGPDLAWEFGTRDTGAYATISDVTAYLEWLGDQVSTQTDRRAKIEAAAEAIHAHEQSLTQALLFGTDNLKGASELNGVEIIGGINNPRREGLVSLRIKGRPSPEVVTLLNDMGIRTHTRKADHYSGNILDPLGWEDCIRISMCHYNSIAEIRRLLSALADITED
jgi:selenocysteine lyase/cysteine desulfurase